VEAWSPALQNTISDVVAVVVVVVVVVYSGVQMFRFPHIGAFQGHEEDTEVPVRPRAPYTLFGWAWRRRRRRILPPKPPLGIRLLPVGDILSSQDNFFFLKHIDLFILISYHLVIYLPAVCQT